MIFTAICITRMSSPVWRICPTMRYSRRRRWPNRMLDMLPEELWHDSRATFLDPACKSGVFLREIAKRLIEGLKEEIPDLQERIDHIFHKQLYGIAITELTSLLSRRSVYCSKYPNSKYSITLFEDTSGNIRYKRIPHRWQNGKCLFCRCVQERIRARGRTGNPRL